MKINSKAKTKDASYPTGWLDLDGSKFKIAGNARPAFQRAFQLAQLKTSEDYQNLFGLGDADAINSARLQDLVILNYLILDWEGITDENGDPLKHSKEAIKMIFLDEDLSNHVVLAVLEKSKKIQQDAEKEKVELLGKSKTESIPTVKAKPTRQSKKQ